MRKNPEWLTEEEAHRVLARAVELDEGRASDVSLVKLREIAEEAGIARDALDRALGELSEVRVPKRFPLSQKLARYRWHAAGASFVAGAMLTPADVVVQTTLLALPIMAAYELAIAIVRRRERKSGGGGESSSPVVAVTAPRAAPRRGDDAPRSLRLGIA
ncbi:MAG: hypothetical protein ABIY52_18965 [Gemmatimonadaceae bacterium]